MALDCVPAQPRSLRAVGDTFVAAPTTRDPRSLEVWVSDDGLLDFATVAHGVRSTQAVFARGTTTQIRNEITKQNIGRLEDAIVAWLQRTGSLPTVAQVRPGAGAFARSITPWPTNPFDDRPMSPGHDRGDFRYHYTAALWSLHWIDAYGHEGVSEGDY